MSQEIPLRKQDAELLDGESNPITLDVCYEVRTNELEATLNKIKQVHGNAVRLLPMSAKSAGGGVFQVPASEAETIVGVHFSPAVVPDVCRQDDVDIKQVKLNEIVINEVDCSVYAGAAITLAQLNQVLNDVLGPQYNVLGADLTSYTYAQVGSTFMTGGMGPQRRYFSDSVVEIALHNGDKIVVIRGDELLDFAGTYGWTGLVCAVKCTFHKLPIEEFAFSIPVKNTAADLAKVLKHLSSYVYWEVSSSATANHESSTLIMGLEHMTVGSMQPLIHSGFNNSNVEIANQIVDKCESSHSDGMIFVYGLSDVSIDDVLCELIDDLEATSLSIAGVDLDHTYNFSNLNEMQELREAMSYSARNQLPTGQYSFKGHTDANIWINPDNLESSIVKIWGAYLDYIEAVEKHFDSSPLVKGEILIYGHLNPRGFDPHNRITFATEDQSSYQQSIKILDQLRNDLTLKLADLCKHTGCVFGGGEKGVGSDHELLVAFDSLDAVPGPLKTKFLRQRDAIKNSSGNFNWRAFKPYYD